METIDEREMQKTTEKQTKAERSKGNRSYTERDTSVVDMLIWSITGQKSLILAKNKPF